MVWYIIAQLYHSAAKRFRGGPILIIVVECVPNSLRRFAFFLSGVPKVQVYYINKLRSREELKIRIRFATRKAPREIIDIAVMHVEIQDASSQIMDDCSSRTPLV